MMAPFASSTARTARPRIEVANLDMAYGGSVIQRNVSFVVKPAEIFVIMGGSGSGKSTLLRHLIGLKAPARGDVSGRCSKVRTDSWW